MLRNHISNGVKVELTWIALSSLIFLFIAWLSGAWLGTLVVYLLFYMARQLWSINQFEKWLNAKVRLLRPPASGVWSELAYLVLKKQQALENQAEQQAYQFEQFQAASMVLPVAIISMTQQNKIEWFNETARRLVGVKSTDVGRKIEALIRQPEFVSYLKQEQFEKPLFLETLMGDTRVYRCEILEYYSGHRLLLLEDVNELYKLAQIRKDFVANASHELRTPLTVLSGYIEMMADMSDTLPAHWGKPLLHMQQQSSRMQAIIEDLLALSKVESDTLMKSIKLVRVDQLLCQIEADTRYLYEQDYDIQFEIEPSLGILGVEEPLKSVFSNLISNAIRYTPVGGKITVRWFSDQKGAHFEVEDTGIGIAKEHLTRLTERFYRVDTARSRDKGGTGLGLAIVKHVLERHQSQLRVHSQVAKGSVFGCDFNSVLVKKESE